MNQALIGVIGTLLGVAIGGLVTYLVNYAQFKREKKLKEQQLIQQKLEEICQTIENIYTIHRPSFSDALTHIRNGADIKFEVINPPFNKLKMLIYFYAPSLKSLYDVLCDIRFLYGISLIELNDCNQKNKPAMFNIVSKTFELFETLCEKISEAAADISRTYFK